MNDAKKLLLRHTLELRTGGDVGGVFSAPRIQAVASGAIAVEKFLPCLGCVSQNPPFRRDRLLRARVLNSRCESR